MAIVKSTGDSITSTNLLGWPKRFLGFDFNDGLVGLGGLTSASIACYQIYPAGKKWIWNSLYKGLIIIGRKLKESWVGL